MIYVPLHIVSKCQLFLEIS